MEDLLIYMLKSAGLLSLFYLAYLLLLKNDTSFIINRKYLLGGILASLILPSLYFKKKIFIEASPQMLEYSAVPANLSLLPVEQALDWWQISGIVYLIVVGFFLLRFFLQIFRIIKMIYAYPHYSSAGYKIIETSQAEGPFSFFNFIVFNPDSHNSKELQLILKHEKVHASQYHTLDILISNLICCVLWFNPFSWYYRKSIVQNLEYIADRETVVATASKKEYLQTLVKVSLGDRQPALTNSFYQSFIKKRIVMLNKKSPETSNLWKIGFVIPMILAFMFTFNVKTEIYAQEKEQVTDTVKNSNLEIILDIDKNTTQDDLNSYTSLMEEYGIILKFSDVQFNNEGFLTSIKVEFIDKSNVSSGSYTQNNTAGIKPFRYIYNEKEGSRFSSPEAHVPITAANTQVHVLRALRNDTIYADSLGNSNYFYSTVKPTYVPGKAIKYRTSTDSTNAGNMTIYRSHPAAVVYKSSLKDGAVFVPGRYKRDSLSMTNYVINADTLVFRRDSLPTRTFVGGAVRFEENPKKSSRNFIFTSNKVQYYDPPLYVVDGKVMGEDFDIRSLDHNRITSINILKGELSTKRFGARGSNGVMEITTSKEENSEKTTIPTFTILKANTTDEGLKIMKRELLKQANLEVDFRNVKRNKEGLITTIKVVGKHQGEEISGTYKETEKIPDIYIGVRNGKVVISTTAPVK